MIGANPAALDSDLLAELAELTALIALLVLDETTACLDPKAEAAIFRRRRAEQAHLAVLMVSHRPGTLEWCDRVLRLESRRG
jgi:ABC-type transport system involved in cytochrome bd biosynthesis fused ATPase/permease subunit